MGDRLAALPGCLAGSWRGVAMHIPDVSTPAGRRMVSVDLPGTDVTLHEDLGLYTGPIRVTGLIVGDDYIARAAAMRAACETEGPGTLVHPWLGEMTVVLKEPADIRFQADRLRTVQVQLTFERWSGSADASGGLATLAAIDDAVTALGDTIIDLCDLATDLVGDVTAAVTDVLDTVESAIDDVLAAADLVTVLAGSTVTVAIDTIAGAAGLVAWVDLVAATLADAGTRRASPAIGVGPLGRSTEAAVDPWTTVAAMLNIAEAVAAASLTADDEGASLVGLAAACDLLGAATEPLAAVDWESRQQALAARATVSAAIDTVATATIAATTATGPTTTARRATWRRLAALRRTIHQDLDDRIGRLPSVMRVTPPSRVSAWIVAQHLFGDDPKAVLSGFEDIVTRNALAHPSICDVDPIEVLPQ